jgi:hypothetical protein
MTTIAAATTYWTATAAAVALVTVTPPPPAVKTHPADAGPFNFTLTREERLVKSRQHKFGLCGSCDTGLNDRADFHCYFNDSKMTLTCNACDSYFGGGDS